MKKILFGIFLLVIGLVFVGCKKVDENQKILDEAHDALMISVSDPAGVVTSFYLNGKLKGGLVLATWTSSNPGVATVGELLPEGDPNAGKYLLTVTRPAYGQDNAPLHLVATLTIPSALDSTKILSKTKDFGITVLANTVAPVIINNIADVLAIRDPKLDGDVLSVVLNHVTIYAKGDDAGFGYDGTGTIMVYTGTGYELNHVYTISGTLDWYFGLWELKSPVFVEEVNATPQIPSKEVVTSVNEKLSALNAAGVWTSAAGTVADGCFEPLYARVTGKIVLNPNEGATSNYRFYLVDVTTADYASGDPAPSPANGFMLYYHTLDFNLFSAYVGIQVTLDIVIHTYRSNNNAYAFYYVGGPSGIDATLTDQQVVDIDALSLNVPTEILTSTNLTLSNEGPNGSTIVWTSTDDAVINHETGVVNAPTEGNVTVTVTATVSYGTATPVVKTYVITVGELGVTDIVDLWALAGATTLATAKQVKVVGKITDLSNFYTNGAVSNTEGFIQDETGGAYLYRVNIPTGVAIGDVVEIVGWAYINSSSGLRISGEDATHQAVIKKVETTVNVTPVVLDLAADDNRVDYRNELVTVSGVVFKKGSNYYLSALNGDATLDIQLYVRSAGYFANGTADRDPFLAALEAASLKHITVTAPLYLYTTTWEFNIDKTSQYSVGADLSTPELVAALAFVTVQFGDLPHNLSSVTASITLPSGLPAGITLAVTSSVPAVISTTGVVVRPEFGESDATVVFGVELLNGVTSLYNYSVTLTVPAQTGVGPVLLYATAKYTAGTTGNLLGAPANNASTLGLDPAIFTVTSAKGSGANETGINAKNYFALYYYSGGAGVVLTISVVSGYTIDSITYTAGHNNGTLAQFTVNGGDPIDISGATTTVVDGVFTGGAIVTGTVAINASSVVIQNVSTSNSQVWFTSIAITYHAVA
ncbi:MAG: hypothetical protein LBV55_00885 [Acholeplasmatales bacterium]|jgi:hypothetical protein|nr:hypothetical protein [Acholeplasmatales bacterium]